jgi:hypothetical protein
MTQPLAENDYIAPDAKRANAGHLAGRIVRLAALAVTVLLGACTNLGSHAISASRTDYNMALRQTEDEQLLLNLVRLRYRDNPLFLEASALNTQFTFQAGADALAEFGDDDVYSLGGRVLVEEKPTMTYTPLQGESFVQRVLSRIPLDTLILLIDSGWSVERVFRVCVQQMNGLTNAPRASGPTPADAPEFEEFAQAARLLKYIGNRGLLAGARRDANTVVVTFAHKALSLPQYAELTRLLDLDPKQRIYPFTTVLERPSHNVINLRTRSFIGVMYFLSQSVQIPPGDVVAGKVTVTYDAAGNEFDWAKVTEGLMRIHSSPKRPTAAAIAVSYRGSWFYIDDADLDSKSTFSMLGQIYSLQSGNAKGLTPVLTLPVGG